ncbi:MAG: gliding motility-associated C-terminal domain-containing protein [Bacteroidales bacterium]|nr:gliding motility-associated C-terminal domain-containing protein [Bacteroidales bacterium]
MKKTDSFVLFLAFLLLGAMHGSVQGQNQNAHCMGLKNPTNFVLTGGAANSAWMGYTGNKPDSPYQASTCTSLGSTFSPTAVPAASLATTTGGTTSCYGQSMTDINGAVDYTRRFVIKGPGTDALTANNLSYLPPDTSFHTSIRLGTPCGGHEAEMLCYEFDVTPKNALVTIWYAVSLYKVFHSAAENPEFVIIVEKRSGTNWVRAAGDTLCYIKQSPTSTSVMGDFLTGTSDNAYLPWNKVIVNLSKLQYQRVRIKIATSDCCWSAHYGYCYFAGECQPMELSANGCAAGESESVARIAAPKGAISYAWYRSKNGPLTGDDVNNAANYELIEGQSDSVLNTVVNHFIRRSDGDTLTQNTFRCKMTTKMHDSYPVITYLPVTVGNTKPALVVDSSLGCNANITLRDLSYTPFHTNDTQLVDTSRTRWYFYSTPNPTSASLVDSVFGGEASHTYPTAGDYSVKVRTRSFGANCWNEKTVKIRTIKSPVPRVNITRNDLCAGDTIIISDITTGSGYHRWTIDDSTFNSPTQAIRWSFDTITDITLLTRGAQFYMDDTTNDGIVERVYCYSDTTFRINVGQYPKLTVIGDTIVCNGDHSDVQVNSTVDNCRYDWYYVMGGTSPVVENSSHLATTITQDRTYFVKVTSPLGCTTWDSINLYLVKPDLQTNKDRICTGDSVRLTAGKAAYFEWSSNPPDPDLNGQSISAEITVSPKETTVYSVIGHGTNGCSATALTQKITVYPYPILHVSLTPDYIDSENPSVQFADLSENSSSSLWNFGNGNTSSTRTVVFTFTDLSQDSILVSLISSNPLGCSRDTSFYVPVGIFAVWFPNAFTPILETNKIFKPYTANILEDYQLFIYDRFGSLVFSTNNIEEGWDGTYKGHDCRQGTYVYIATYRRSGVERLMTQKGTVTLIR